MDQNARGGICLDILVVGCDPVAEQGVASLLSTQSCWIVRFMSLSECLVASDVNAHVALLVTFRFTASENQCIRHLRAHHVKVLLYGADSSTAVLRQAISAGADGFVYSGATPDELLSAINACAAGRHILLTGNETNQLYCALHSAAPPTKFPTLATEREQEVLALLSKGFSNEQIAQRLQISIGTVKAHVGNLLRKNGLKSRTQLAISTTRMIR